MIDRLREILDALTPPVRLALKDNFSRLANIQGLEGLVTRMSQEGLLIASSPKIRRLFTDLKDNFRDFERAGRADQEAKIRRAKRLLDEMGLILSSMDVLKRYDHQEQSRLLRTPVRFIKGVGTKLAFLLKKKGIETIEDALYNLPLRYEDRREIRRIADLTIGERGVGDAYVIAAGEVIYPKSRRKIYEVILGDESGFITAKWFQGTQYIKARLQKGDRVIFCGEIRGYRARMEIHHPDLEWVEGGEEMELDSLHFGRIVPVYSETEGLSQRRIRTIMHHVVDEYVPKLSSPIPDSVIRRATLMSISEAFAEVHFPQHYSDLERLNLKISPPHQRLAFEEFFFLELGMALRRRGIAVAKGIAFRIAKTPTVDVLLKKLPFTLTQAQERVVEEIKGDMVSPHPMNRLLQGDVGSGKTVVALLASLIAIDNGYQAALMAPTEILAEQHYLTLQEWLNRQDVRVVLLTSSIKGKERDKRYRAIQEQQAHLVVGTHALIQEDLIFGKLGLAVVDEQHRFGVMQRARLRRKGTVPDLLVMTATPIPRTLAMTIYGDMEVSVLDELPPGRGSILTKVYRERNREKVYELVRRELAKGRQAYVVYPLVEESERTDLRDATQGAERLQREVFPHNTVGLIHGRMKGEEKEKIMRAFKDSDIQILVATTVIEVGIDCPNATVMIIEHAERFGLSQLHQMRGRIRRGSHSSLCLLFTKMSVTKEAWRRLKVMEQTTDGFRIAEEDLSIRGPGEFLGVRQWGLPDFRVANLIRDVRLLQEARQEAFALIGQDPQLNSEVHRPLRDVLRERWQEKLELADVG